jgi:hypothetical protein
MDLPGEIIKSVIDSRSALGDLPTPTAPVDGLTAVASSSPPETLKKPPPKCEVPEMTIQQAEHILSFGLPIAIHIVLVHEDCKMSDPCECSCAKQVEVWTVRRQKVVNEGVSRQKIAKTE